jgi:hypothetical protein
MKLRQASQWSSIGIKRLKSLAESGVIIGFQDPDAGTGEWIFDRYSIDEYRLRQADPAQDRAKVLKLMEGVGHAAF